MSEPFSKPAETAAIPAAPDFGAMKTKQQVAWSSGNYAVVGVSLQLMGELLCEALDVRSTWTVLDVAAGNGNVTLAAARRGCRVTSTDYVPSLLEQGRARAEAESLHIEFQEADAENLPFADGSYDCVVSTVGVMFAPDQKSAAAEMFRVCKPGGKIGLACWTPGSFVGGIFKTIGKFLPPPAGVTPPSAWGTESRLRELFPAAASITIETLDFNFRSRSTAAWLEHFKTYYGPMFKTYAALDEHRQAELTADLIALADRFNRAQDGTMVLPSEYIEVVIVK